MRIRWRSRFRRFLPAIISGGADNDPSGVATYAISGALFGFQQLWLLLFSTPMLIAVQAMCARLGDVKRKGLMAIIREHYAPVVAVVASCILIITNIATLGADLTAMAEGLSLVTNVPIAFWVLPVAIFLWYIIVFRDYKTIERYLFFLTFVFIAYIIAGILARPRWAEVLIALFHPTITYSSSYFITGLGLLGTTITPFLFFWQAKQEVEEHKAKRELLREAKQEDAITAPGFIYSNVVSLFIVIATAAALYNPSGNISTISAATAARALEPIAGTFAKYLFAIGIIGAGLLAVPILAVSTAYVVSETFGWRDSLSDKPTRAKGFYIVLTASIVVGVIIAMSGVNPMQVLLYSQVMSGMLAPILITLILLMCNDKKIMGSYINHWFDNLFGWLAVIVMTLGSAGLFFQLFAR